MFSQKKKEEVSQQNENPFEENSETDKPEKKVNEEGDVYWEIGNHRRVTVNKYGGKILVHIRQYYEKDGKQLPGKKGITLQKDAWDNLKLLSADIDNEMLNREGESKKKVKKR